MSTYNSDKVIEIVKLAEYHHEMSRQPVKGGDAD